MVIGAKNEKKSKSSSEEYRERYQQEKDSAIAKELRPAVEKRVFFMSDQNFYNSV
jgi:hypothetical protein